MGRKTFESILKRLGKPLPNRKNVVVTRDKNYKVPLTPTPLPKGEGKPTAGQGDGICLHSNIDEALAHHAQEEVMVAGGGEIFKQTIDRADTLCITEVHQEVQGDVYFPKIEPSQWKEAARETHEGFAFVTYIHK